MLLVGSEGGSYAAAPGVGGGARRAVREAAEEASEQLARQGVRQAAREAGEEASRLLPKRFSRYMSEAELKAVQETGLLRGGRPGETYFTTNKFRRAISAMRRLSLKHKPEVRVDFEITNSPTIFGPRPVMPHYGQPGGGIEYWTVNDPVQVRILRVLHLE